MPFSPELLQELLIFLDTVYTVGKSITSGLDALENGLVEDDITLGSLDNTQSSVENDSATGSKERVPNKKRRDR